MAIADTINSMKTNITNAYNAVQTKGGTIPTNKNLENLSTAINSIEAGGGIEDVATVSALKAKVTEENIGKFYKYTGASSDGFESNALYQVVRDTFGGDTPLMLGLGKVSVNADKYTITYNYTNCGDDFPITNMPLGGIVTSNVYTLGDYVLPNAITVSGCQYTWTLSTDKKQGTLKLYNSTGNITVTIAAEKNLTADAVTIMKMFNQDLIMKPVMNQSKATEFADAYAALNGSDQQRFTDFYNVMTKTALPLMQRGWQADYDEVYNLIVKDTYWEKCNWTVSEVNIDKGKGLVIVLKSPKYDFFWLTAELNN
uniref:Uncharacterized protein n=1 Tax=Siphoviridae sp. cttDR14 TaxID=2826490 RepID=A0A8S5M2E0_9CAUD|nr:MAG TPA: hypothetical protein [Siphoviridae sp. cttDR14]